MCHLLGHPPSQITFQLRVSATRHERQQGRPREHSTQGEGLECRVALRSTCLNLWLLSQEPRACQGCRWMDTSAVRLPSVHHVLLLGSPQPWQAGHSDQCEEEVPGPSPGNFKET